MPRRSNCSRQAAKLFAALAMRPNAWRHGYDLLRQTGLASGTLYPLLMRLHEAGYLEARWEEPVMPARAPRHSYRLTASGAAFGRALLAESKMHSARRLREKLA
jgi:DNA-binding PadR family transcriptional regulator